MYALTVNFCVLQDRVRWVRCGSGSGVLPPGWGPGPVPERWGDTPLLRQNERTPRQLQEICKLAFTVSLSMACSLFYWEIPVCAEKSFNLKVTSYSEMWFEQTCWKGINAKSVSFFQILTIFYAHWIQQITYTSGTLLCCNLVSLLYFIYKVLSMW